MAERPDVKAFVVEDSREPESKGFWHEVGVGWKHERGSGLNLFIPAGISVTGRIVIVENTQKSEPGRSAGRETARAAPGASGSEPRQ